MQIVICFVCMILGRSHCAGQTVGKVTHSQLRDSLVVIVDSIEAIEPDSIWINYNIKLGQTCREYLSQSTITNDRVFGLRYLAKYYYYNGLYYFNAGQLSIALKEHLRSLKIADSIGDTLQVVIQQNEIGKVYNLSGDNVNALNYFAQALNNATLIADSGLEAAALNNMATVQNNLNNPGAALNAFAKSAHLFSAMNNNLDLASALNNIGGIFEKMGSVDSASYYYNKANTIFKNTNYLYGLYVTNIEFGNLALTRKNITKAEYHFTIAAAYADTLNNLQTRLGSAKHFTKLFAAKGDYKKAYYYSELYRVLSDSLRNDEKRLSLMKLQAGFDYDLRENKLRQESLLKEAQSQQKLEREKIIRYAILSLVFILAIAAWLVIWLRRRRSELFYKHKMTELRMQAINAQMNPHFIFNCIQSIQSKINNHDAADAEQSLMQFARLIRKVLDHSAQFSVSLQEEEELLADYVALEKLRLNFPLDYSFTVSSDVDAHAISIPPLLLQPVVENAIIHGIKPLQRAGKLKVEVTRVRQTLRIEIADNGEGMPSDNSGNNSRKSYGIPLTRERLTHLSAMHNLPATYEVTHKLFDGQIIAGTVVTICIPILD